MNFVDRPLQLSCTQLLLDGDHPMIHTYLGYHAPHYCKNPTKKTPPQKMWFLRRISDESLETHVYNLRFLEHNTGKHTSPMDEER
jgi:hypothetical protein